MRILIQDTTSEFYRGPKTEQPFALYAELKEKGVYITFKAEIDFPSALAKAGVELFKALNPDFKLSVVKTNTPTPH